MTAAALETAGLGKRYRHTWALADCTLSVPAGHVVGLVGPNGAGKTTLLGIATGMLAPTAGTIEVLGARPGGRRRSTRPSPTAPPSTSPRAGSAS